MLVTSRPERQILRVADLQTQLGLSRTTIWRLRRAGEFPQPIRLSANAVGWARPPHRRMAHSAPRGVTRRTSPLKGVAAGLDPMARSARCRGCRPLLAELPPHRSRTRWSRTI